MTAVDGYCSIGSDPRPDLGDVKILVRATNWLGDAVCRCRRCEPCEAGFPSPNYDSGAAIGSRAYEGEHCWTGLSR